MYECRWQAGKGEGAPGGQEAVKVSSSYEDQTAGPSRGSKLPPPSHSRCGLHSRTRGTHKHLCVFSPQRILGCRVCVSVCDLISMQKLMYKRMHFAPAEAPPPSSLLLPASLELLQIHLKGLVSIISGHVLATLSAFQPLMRTRLCKTRPPISHMLPLILTR